MLDIKSIIKYTSSLKLLYVEDNKDARESTLSILEEFFDDIIVACHGLEGLEKFQQNDIDLIITDINMPKMTGLKMVEKIRETDKDVSILILSAYNESGFFIDSIKLNVDGYLLKPIDLEQFLSMLQKITQKITLKDEKNKLLYLQKQYQEITDTSSIVSKADLAGNIIYANDKFCEISGYTEEELIGKPHNIIRHPDNPASMFENMWDTIKNKKEMWQGVVRNIKKDGSSYYVQAVIKPILNQKNEIVEYIALRDDITDIMSPKKQLQDLIEFFDESLVVFVKIERFEDIEKFYGSFLSQKIENSFSKEILKQMPTSSMFEKVFSLGDGEYALARNKEDLEIDVEKFIEMLKEFHKNINDVNLDIGEFEYDISTIISVAYGKDALSNAKSGLKHIIKTNQDFIVATNFEQKEYEEAAKNLKILKMVKKAIENKKIVSYFQPIINNKTKKIEKYESLVRLIDEDGKILAPFFFLDTAKKGKYYSQITLIVLENSFDALTKSDVDITINISILDIEKSATREEIFKLLNDNKNYLKRVVFELLEDENVKDFKLIKKFIEDVKAMGVRIAIDDFGAGYSNFERLLDYQPDILKIDGSLIKNILDDQFSLNVVQTIVSFAKKQHIKIVAEFVENVEIFEMLKDMGVDYSQGYYFGKPEALKIKDVV